MFVILTIKNFYDPGTKIMGLGKKFLATLALTGALSGAANTSVELHKYSEQSALPIPQLQVGKIANAGLGNDVRWLYQNGMKLKTWYGWAAAVGGCGLQYYNNSGFCERNPKLVYFGYDKVLSGMLIPCTQGYEERQANIFARNNNLKYLFWTPANKTFTFEKK
jgi:hypothetical protein